MPGEGRREKKQEGEAQRMFIEPQYPAAAAHRPGRTRLIAIEAGIAIDVLGRVERFRFRRPPLPEPNGKEDVDTHLEELTLHILGGGLDKVSWREKAEEGGA